MNKKLRSLVSSLVPKGRVKELLKLWYYSMLSRRQVRFGLDRNGIYSTSINGIPFRTHEATYFAVEDIERYLFFYKVQPGDKVIDAGANVGQLSIYFAQLVGPAGHVYSFEPDRYNLHSLKRNVDLNKLSDRITSVELLLWNKHTMLDFYEVGTPGSSAHWMPEASKVVKKQAVTMDAWVCEQQLDRVNFIKMDIEGAEIEALEGCVDTIKRLRPNFAIASYHVVNGRQTYLWVEEFFKGHDYPFKTIRFGKDELITFAGPNVV